jgi:tetraacyldisaccharide 4'-kinase
MSVSFEALWYGKHPLALCLAPVGWLFAAAALTRELFYRLRIFPSVRATVPVIVIGNITVGGTGKTPLTIWAANELKRHGFRPGIVCRGYKGRANQWPQQVRSDSDPAMVGDEPVLLAQRTGCPVAAGPDRAAAVAALVAHSGCDAVISDDGLQHLGLCRDIEIAVLDGVRRLGNGRCLPAGPLREPAGRLKSVDFVVSNGGAQQGEVEMRTRLADAASLRDPTLTRPLEAFRGRPVHAVCGIGNPARFFDQLEAAGLEIIRHAFPDHHPFLPAEIEFEDGNAVLMTEKDAVKCARIASEGQWFVPVDAVLPDSFSRALVEMLERVPAR